MQPYAFRAQALELPKLPDRVARPQVPALPPPTAIVPDQRPAERPFLPPWLRTCAGVILVGLLSGYVAQKFAATPESSAHTHPAPVTTVAPPPSTAQDAPE
ncbi:MAG: hypothetical protein JO022_15475, partial [Acidobacteriaceae bacterium]|nr:hypothetical protein [Acidobacteriaceae bacterium]